MQTAKRLGSLAILLVTLAGCAAPPNTPGAGSGKNYTPVIDTQGADTTRYSSDLDACRRLAGYVDENKAAMQGAIGGAIVGAAIAAMLGGNARTMDQTASVGAFSGLGQQSGAAIAKQERIMINCMAGRGYRTLDGGAISPVAYSPSPAAAQQAAATANPLPAQPLTYDPIPAASESVVVAKAPAADESGQWSYQVERLAEVKKCNPVPRAKMTGKGPGMENYTVACSDGDFVSARCEFGQCRVLR